MSDTPRIDAILMRAGSFDPQTEVVSATLARIMDRELAQAKAELATEREARKSAEHYRDLYLDVNERFKLALNMPGTGNQVDFAKECRAAWERCESAERRAEKGASVLSALLGDVIRCSAWGWFRDQPTVKAARAYLNAKEGKG